MTPEKQDLLAQKIVKYFFFSFSFLIFVLFTIGGYGIEEHYAQVRTWSPVTAKVHSISMEEEHRSKGTTYCINSQIIYDYNGASYTSTPRSLFSCHPIKVYAQKTLNQNPPGTPVQVLVNPKDPIQSHGPLRFDYIKLPPLVTLGIFLGIIVLATGFFYFSHQRKLPNVMK